MMAVDRGRLVGVDFARGRLRPRSIRPSGAQCRPTARSSRCRRSCATGPSPRSVRLQLAAAPVVPQRGTGTFALAAGEMPRVGTRPADDLPGRVRERQRRARRQVRRAGRRHAARPRRAGPPNGEWAFRRVSQRQGRLRRAPRHPATPSTRICGAAGLQTGGYVSCRTGQFVMINLARWELAVPDYKGDVALYRRYVVNHEVGHRLGHGHEACPGQGQAGADHAAADVRAGRLRRERLAVRQRAVREGPARPSRQLTGTPPPAGRPARLSERDGRSPVSQDPDRGEQC